MSGKLIISALAAAMACTAAARSNTAWPWPAQSFTNPSVERTPTALVLRMDVNPSAFTDIKSDRQVWLKPAVAGGADTLWFAPVVVAGRVRYNQNIRTRALPDNAIQLRAGAPEPYAYQAIVPYEPWMDYCELVLTGTVSGCCGDGLGRMTPDQPLASCDFRVKELNPTYIYVSPTQEFVKMREASGRAYIDFRVGRTNIVADYRNNEAELAKIRSSIDCVRDDSDVTITGISFKGYASPEGAYALNERLAEGRTEALIDYVRKLYAFPADLMHASWVAEDWDGLVERLRTMDIANRDALLAIATDTDLTPDQKDYRLKADYPAQYAVLLEQVYPALRRCDYVINYNVRNYTDVAEIARVMATSPQNLSLAEIFLYAKSLDNSSAEFREVMEVAVRMFPDDPEANLNAATTAVDHGEYDLARSYLKKAPDTPQAAYTAGLLEARTGNYEAAQPLLQRAADAGIAEAAVLLDQMRQWNWIK